MNVRGGYRIEEQETAGRNYYAVYAPGSEVHFGSAPTIAKAKELIVWHRKTRRDALLQRGRLPLVGSASVPMGEGDARDLVEHLPPHDTGNCPKCLGPVQNIETGAR